MTESKSTGAIVCLQCRHYYITWQPSFPYGCRAMGFRSKRSPALEVEDASGMPCLRFQLKEHLINRQ